MPAQLFPAIHKTNFDTEHFNNLLAKRNHLDYECYMLLCKVLDDLSEHHYQEANELINNRDIACGELLNYLTTGEKPWISS